MNEDASFSRSHLPNGCGASHWSLCPCSVLGKDCWNELFAFANLVDAKLNFADRQIDCRYNLPRSHLIEGKHCRGFVGGWAGLNPAESDVAGVSFECSRKVGPGQGRNSPKNSDYCS